MAGAVSAFAIAYGIMQLLAGPLGDRFGKARVVACAALGCGLASLFTSITTSLTTLTLGRGAMGATAAGIIPLTMAWIGDTVPWERRQVVLAQLLCYTVVGMMAGVWAGGVLSDAVGWRWAFVLVGLLLIGAAAAIQWHLRSSPVTHRTSGYLTQVRSLFRDPTARHLYAVTMVEGALVFGSLAFVPSALYQRFGVSLTTAGAVLALFGAGGLIYAQTAGRLLARLERDRLATVGGTLLCISFILLATMPRWWWGLPASLMAGLGFYMLHGTLQACATQLSTAARGTAVSLFACSLFFGQSIGVSLMAQGFSRDMFGAFMAAAGVALLILAATFGVRLRAATS